MRKIKSFWNKVLSVLISIAFIISILGIYPKNSIVVAAEYEYAWFPVNQVNITQLCFESYSHSYSYHFDCKGKNAPGSDYAFAPFTGKVKQ